jgi:tRNA (guanine-N7-)-methyltransferase
MRSEIEIDASGVEYELGVPIAGRILAQDAWVKTALHRLPDGQFQAAEEFGRVAELILDLGCGNGRFTIGSAVARPECDHLAIDSLPVVIRYATRRGRQRGLSNTRFAVCDGMEFLRRWLPDQSVSELHIYHPQPFQEASQIDQRLFTPRFLAEAHRVLRTGGRMFLQSDNPAYWDYLRKSVGAIFAWHDQEGPWDGEGTFRSRREIIATRKGLKIFRAWAVRREWSEADLEAAIGMLPKPDFQATPKRNRTGWTRGRK